MEYQHDLRDCLGSDTNPGRSWKRSAKRIKTGRQTCLRPKKDEKKNGFKIKYRNPLDERLGEHATQRQEPKIRSPRVVIPRITRVGIYFVHCFIFRLHQRQLFVQLPSSGQDFKGSNSYFFSFHVALCRYFLNEKLPHKVEVWIDFLEAIKITVVTYYAQSQKCLFGVLSKVVT